MGREEKIRGGVCWSRKSVTDSDPSEIKAAFENMKTLSSV